MLSHGEQVCSAEMPQCLRREELGACFGCFSLDLSCFRRRNSQKRSAFSDGLGGMVVSY